MDSAFLHFTYLGRFEYSHGWGESSITLYECKECLSLVQESSVPDHFTKHGIA